LARLKNEDETAKYSKVMRFRDLYVTQYSHMNDGIAIVLDLLHISWDQYSNSMLLDASA
jgi:hypothetical protein